MILNQKIFSIKYNIFLNILYEDKYIFLINKPSGLVVHPGCGNEDGTLLDILLHERCYLKDVPRSGIIHRLDKNTTGLMIIAKDSITYYKLIDLMKNRQIIREYDAFVLGKLISGGTVSIPIMRNIKNRISMITHKFGKKAITHYKIIQKFRFYTHIHLKLETGRTHQIRVHMLYLKHPILGDPLYKLGNNIPKNILKKNINKISSFHRQALHASHIKFIHPITNILVDCYSTLPHDMVNIIKYL